MSLSAGRDELGVLASCSALLGWDEQTYMPPGGSAHRGEQLRSPGRAAPRARHRRPDRRAARHRRGVGSDLLADPDTPPAVNIRELRRGYDRRTRLPRDLVEELARTTSLAQQEWIDRAA